MIMKVSVFFFVCLMLVCACTGRKQQVADEIKVLQAKEIQIPSKLPVMKRGEKVADFEGGNPMGLKLVVYADSVGCTACAINHIYTWSSLVDYAKGFSGRLKFYFIFSPMKREVRSTELLIANTNFDYPILIDTLGEFERLNPHLPKNQALHTFLLDENNRVILVGNPLRNKKIKEMFYKIVEDKLGKPGEVAVKEN